MKFEEFIATFTQYVKRIQMQPRIRDVVRERLSAYADLHVVREAAKKVGRFSFIESLNLQLLRAGFVVFVLAAGTGGIAYASGDALPGDTLYPVKVKFVEPLETALLVGPETRATWNAILAERRLAEAAALATRSALTEDTRAYLEERFAYHADLAESAADEVDAEGDAAVGLAVRSDLEARIAAHADLFAYLATEERQEERRFLDTIARARDKVAAERERSESMIASGRLAYGNRQVEAAAMRTDEVAKDLKEKGVTEEAIESKIVAARDAISAARSSLTKDEEGVAFVATQAATRLTQEATILAKNRSIIALGNPTSSSVPTSGTDNASRPSIMMKLPGFTTATSTDSGTTTDAGTEDAKDEEKPKKSSRTEDASSDSQGSDNERSSDSGSSGGSSVSGAVKKTIKSLLGN